MKKQMLLISSFAALIHLSCSPAEDPVATPNNSVTTVFTSGQTATNVVGQPDFTTASSNWAANKMNGPRSVSVASDGKMYVAEQLNNRVLVFNTVPTTDGATANYSIGQPAVDGNFTGSGADEMNQAWAVSTAGTQVFVAAGSNYRVNIYNSSSQGVSSSVGVGQATPATATNPGGGVGATTIRAPYGVSVGGSKMAVADGAHHRVSLYNSIPSSGPATIDVVLGQANKTSGASGSNTVMNMPIGVWTNGTKIVVADTNNHRVLIWNSWPVSDGTAPDLILGQSALTGNSANAGGVSPAADTIASPQGVHSDGTNLLVADGANNRVLMWTSWPTANKQAANFVFGQADFTTATTGTTAATMSGPTGVHIISASSFAVADGGNNRVLIFNKR